MEPSWGLVGDEADNSGGIRAWACAEDFRLILRVLEGPGGFSAERRQGPNSERDRSGCSSETGWEEVVAGTGYWAMLVVLRYEGNRCVHDTFWVMN